MGDDLHLSIRCNGRLYIAMDPHRKPRTIHSTFKFFIFLPPRKNKKSVHVILTKKAQEIGAAGMPDGQSSFGQQFEVGQIGDGEDGFALRVKQSPF